MNELTLKDRVVSRLKALPRSISYKQVADETAVGHSWICMLVTGRIDNPGVKNLEKLDAYLAKQAKAVS